MALPIKRWQIAPALTSAQYRPFKGMTRALATILYHRGQTDHLAAERFLRGETELASPMQMRGIPKAVGRIRQAVKRGESIVVYGDFDADGVTSTVLLVTALKAIGANVRPYIPHRVDEGYGLNSAALCKLSQQGAQVVITVDCGIRSLAEADDARSYGLDLIVTDHHSVGPQVPDAYAVINPKQLDCKYGENMLAGVGIAYRLADALFRATVNDRKPPPFPVEDLLDLVAIGTVADLAPLDRAENRAMVIRGLARMREHPRPGVKALLAVSGVDPLSATAETIGFRLGPRINAAGRLASADAAYRLLMAETEAEAAPFAEQLQSLNVKRQELTRQMQEYAAQLVGDPKSVPLIFAVSGEFQQGIVGLVAGRLTEEYHRPAVILHRGEEESHGSCRSIEGFNITDALDLCADLLLRHGGHAQAAGFAVHNDNLEAFRNRLMRIASYRTGIPVEAMPDAILDELLGMGEPPPAIDLTPIMKIDTEAHLHELTTDLAMELKRLEPTGHGNPAPVLCSRRLRIRQRRPIGSDNAHLKLRLAEQECEFEAIGFRMGGLIAELPEYVNVAYGLELNEWQGNTRLQLVIQDIQPA